MRFLGIDLAWGLGSPGRPANETGVAVLDEAGRVLDAGWTRGLEETVERIVAVDGDALAFVDAPLVVTNPTGQRRCETQVGQRYGRWKVSANASNLRLPWLAGVALRERLEDAGWRCDDGLAGPPAGGRSVSETYPYTTLVGTPELGYALERPRYKRKPPGLDPARWRAERRATCDELVRRLGALETADPPLLLDSHPVTRRLRAEGSPLVDRAYKHREDLVDALLAGWTAALWWRAGFDRCQVLGEPGATIIAPARPEQRRP